jgi:hypothetical protein
MKKLLYASFSLALTACGENATEVPANRLASNDFESVEGWFGDSTPASLTKEKAHSGRYAVKVDPNTEFSMGYSNLLGKLSASKLKKIKIHAWVHIPVGGPNAVLVTHITDPANPSAQPVLWDGLRLAEATKGRNKWVEVEKEITLPANITYAHKIQVYLWRTANAETTFMDDLTISKVE